MIIYFGLNLLNSYLNVLVKIEIKTDFNSSVFKRGILNLKSTRQEGSLIRFLRELKVYNVQCKKRTAGDNRYVSVYY